MPGAEQRGGQGWTRRDVLRFLGIGAVATGAAVIGAGCGNDELSLTAAEDKAVMDKMFKSGALGSDIRSQADLNVANKRAELAEKVLHIPECAGQGNSAPQECFTPKGTAKYNLEEAARDLVHQRGSREAVTAYFRGVAEGKKIKGFPQPGK